MVSHITDERELTNSRPQNRRNGILVGVDQAVYSLSNFGASALAAGLLSARQFGAFAIATTCYVIMLGIMRAWTGHVLMIRASAKDERAIADAAARALSAGALGSLVASALLIAVALMTSGDVRRALVALSVAAPFLLIQDVYRYFMFVSRRPRQAIIIDSWWLVTTLIGMMALRLTDTESVALAVLVWAAGAIPGAVMGLSVSCRVDPRIAVREWLAIARPLSTRMSIEFAVMSVSGFTMLILLAGSTNDLSLAGAIRAGQVLMGPVSVAFLASMVALQPRMVKAVADGLEPRGLAIRQSVFNAAGTVCYATLVALIPDRVGVRVFGRAWHDARELLIWVAMAFVGMALYTGATNELRARQLVGLALKCRTAVAVVVTSSTLATYSVLGLDSSVSAFAMATLVAVAIPWLALRKAKPGPRDRTLRSAS